MLSPQILIPIIPVAALIQRTLAGLFAGYSEIQGPKVFYIMLTVTSGAHRGCHSQVADSCSCPQRAKQPHHDRYTKAGRLSSIIGILHGIRRTMLYLVTSCPPSCCHRRIRPSRQPW
ncbi:hypothetical protein BDW74DRAFT_154095 [Aspergillus multicolor]|uniref:uncharacterized protein n=1 Tax=Aspergillus multicolor TaxID=41759 RepID=UPI003CCD0DD3